jgi:hypothetical protein
MVVHIRAEASPEDSHMLNKNLRALFGVRTLVFTTDKDIAFFVLEPMTMEELIKWSKSGSPTFVQDGRQTPVILDMEVEPIDGTIQGGKEII